MRKRTIEQFNKLDEDGKKDEKTYGLYDDKIHKEMIPGAETDYIESINKFEANKTEFFKPQVQGARTCHCGTPSYSSDINDIPNSATKGKREFFKIIKIENKTYEISTEPIVIDPITDETGAAGTGKVKNDKLKN